MRAAWAAARSWWANRGQVEAVVAMEMGQLTPTPPSSPALGVMDEAAQLAELEALSGDILALRQERNRLVLEVGQARLGLAAAKALEKEVAAMAVRKGIYAVISLMI